MALRMAGVTLVVSLAAGALADGSEPRRLRPRDFQVNSYTTGAQAFPQIAARPGGGFVVVWQSNHELGPDAPGLPNGAGRSGVFGRIFDRFGRPMGEEFLVNQYTTGRQFRPAVAVAPDGEFVVAWSGYGDGGSGSEYTYGGQVFSLGGYGIFARQFAPDGTPFGGDFQVNTYTTNYQGYRTSVAMSASGDFVVVWQSGLARDAAPQDGSAYGIFGRQFAASGVPLGGEFQVNTYTTSGQVFPSVAMAANGAFAVVWQSVHDGDGVGIFGQRFDADGERLGGEFRVNTYTLGRQSRPSIAAAANGDFVVTWTDYGGALGSHDGSLAGIFGQRFARTGRRSGPEFRVNTYTTGHQRQACVAAEPDGDFVVTWTSGLPAPFGVSQDGSDSGIFGQAFAAHGARRGHEFQVNTYTTGAQAGACVAAYPSGDFVVAWGSAGQDGSSGGVFGRRFDRPWK